MAIQVPSDIVLEVSKAVDPERYQVAAAKLQRLGETAGTAFAEVLEKKVEVAQSATQPAERPSLAGPSLAFDVGRARLKLRNDTASITHLTQARSAASDPDSRAKALQQFEAFVLQSFIGSMLPEDAENVYGEGTAGSIWKSMLAEQLGNAMAKSGGIGIADKILPANAAIGNGLKSRSGARDLATLGIGRTPNSQPLPATTLAAMLSNVSRF